MPEIRKRPSDEVELVGVTDDSGEIARPSDDTPPVIAYADILDYLKGRNAPLNIGVREYFESSIDNGTPRPKLEFFKKKFFYQVQSGVNTQPLAVHHNIISQDGTAMTLLVLNAQSVDLFAKVLIRNMPILDPGDYDFLARKALDCYYRAGAFMALYEDNLYGKRPETRDDRQLFVRHVRAARKVLDGLIGEGNLDDLEDPIHPYRVAAGWAFDQLIEELSDPEGGYDGPGVDAIASRRARIAAELYGLTADNFFLGLAAPYGDEMRSAFVTASMRSRIINPVD